MVKFLQGKRGLALFFNTLARPVGSALLETMSSSSGKIKHKGKKQSARILSMMVANTVTR